MSCLYWWQARHSWTVLTEMYRRVQHLLGFVSRRRKLLPLSQYRTRRTMRSCPLYWFPRAPNSTQPLGAGIPTLNTRARISYKRRSGIVAKRGASHTVPCAQYVVYTSWVEHHTKQDGGGMDDWPTFKTCDARPCVFGDVLYHVSNWQVHQSMEDLLEADGIEDYHRFICGFHIHGIAESRSILRCVRLIGITKTDKQRIKDANVWVHCLLLDQVSPVDFWQSEVLQRGGQYTWPQHRIGTDSSWREQGV